MRDFSTLRILPRSGSTACVERSRPCLAEPPAESPSTMKISAISGSLTMQSASLPGRPMPPIADLRAVSRALRAAARAREASTALRTILSASFGFSSRNSASFALTTEETKPCMPGVAELGLRLALELRVGQLDRDDRGQALADVLALEVLVLLLEDARVARVVVDRARQRRAEARQVRAALVRVDVVGEREDGLLVGAVPLHRDLDRALVALAREEDDLLLERVLVLVEVADEVLDAALVVELARVLPPSPRSSVIEIRRPRVRNAVSRRRCSSVAYSKCSVSKISSSGRKVIVVPVSSVASPCSIGPCGAPRT